MQPSGLRQVELARADGRWDAAYAGQSNATVPDDLQEALDNNPPALAFFLTLNSTNRYAIIFRVQMAKKAETRAARIQKFVEMNEESMLYPDIRSAITSRVTHLVGASRADRLLAEIDVEMLIDL